jgi:GNAT superfamily N-acetyltransferase
MATLRHATIHDAALITQHRHKMFTDNAFATEAFLDAMDANFEPWVSERLADGRYVGLIMEEEDVVLASAGVFFADFPPHFLDVNAGRPYLTNFYTAAEARGRGFAKQMLTASIDICRERGHDVAVLHASPFGRPIYEKFGFEQTNEMMLKLEPQKIPAAPGIIGHGA